jgi:all-trans-retinol dehydrogenase (NAD+)
MIKQANGEAYAYQVDLTKKEDVYRMADRVKKEIGNV